MGSGNDFILTLKSALQLYRNLFKLCFFLGVVVSVFKEYVFLRIMQTGLLASFQKMLVSVQVNPQIKMPADLVLSIIALLLVSVVSAFIILSVVGVILSAKERLSIKQMLMFF